MEKYSYEKEKQKFRCILDLEIQSETHLLKQVTNLRTQYFLPIVNIPLFDF